MGFAYTKGRFNDFGVSCAATSHRSGTLTLKEYTDSSELLIKISILTRLNRVLVKLSVIFHHASQFLKIFWETETTGILLRYHTVPLRRLVVAHGLFKLLNHPYTV